MDIPFREISVTGPVDARFEAPPSKSVTQRALIVASLATGPSLLCAPLESADTLTLLKALGDLGIQSRCGPEGWQIRGQGGRIPSPGAVLDAGDAGTAARFLTALVCLGHGRFVVDGSERMRQRPILPLVEALAGLGARARCLGEKGCPPVEVLADGLPGGTVRIHAGMSSQYVSALLMAAPKAAAPIRLVPEGRVASVPYLRLTLDVMASFGVAPAEEPGPVFEVSAPRDYRGREYRIEGDYSSAGYFFAAAAITGGRVRVGNLRPDSPQGDRGVLSAMETMGCRVSPEPDGWTVTGGELRGFDLDASGMPDAAQTLAVVALFARGASRLRGLGTLRIKETDRIAALAREIRRLGAEAREGPDFLEIRPGPLHGAEIETYRDHRMAMSFSLAGLRIPGVRILDPGCVVKSFPAFWDELDRLTAPPQE
jgi:3-phosphoshikimate 1-carboxyvinyltransferase